MKKLVVLFCVILLGLPGWAQSIDSMERITIRDVHITGNYKTKPHIILRELSFKKGETYFIHQFDSIFEWNRNRIYNTNLFNEVDFEIINQKSGFADIDIKVDERWYLYPIPIFRLADRNFNDWWVNQNRDLSRANIGLKLTQFNFRGRAERLQISGQFGFETRVSFDYRIPYIERTQKHGISISSSYLESKNLAYTTEKNLSRFLKSDQLLRKLYANSFTYQFRNSFYSFHFLTANHISVNVADTIASLNPNYFGNGRTSQKFMTLSYSYSWDKRNNKNYPTRGEWYFGSISKFGIGIYNDVDYWRASFGLNKYMELSKNLFYSGSLLGLYSTPNNRAYYNYTSIGFRKTVVRGFDLKVIEASRYLIQKNEIKLQLFHHKQNISKVMPVRQFHTFPITVFGKLIFDSAVTTSFPNYEGSAPLNDKLIYSYGAGLDILTLYDSVIRLEFLKTSENTTHFFLNFGTVL